MTTKTPRKIRYAVLGLGHIAQTAVLPAFKHAKKNTELKALISSDPKKLKILSKMYNVKDTYSETEFLECLENSQIDALYIATPNTDHQFYAEKAISRGIHVLCEKPVTTSVDSCKSIMQSLKGTNVKFMVAYRLHFDPANLRAIDIAKSGKLGELRYFSSTFSFQIKDEDNIRLKKIKGGGPINDIGIYCINASRYLFADEPVEVFAMSGTTSSDSRFQEVPEMVSVTMKFPKERIAQFICSFGAGDSSTYTLMGTKGSLSLDSAYEYADKMKLSVQIGDKEKVHTITKHDQFAPELIYFSDCILNDKTPEPSVLEGMADLAVIEAIEESLESGIPVKVTTVSKAERPSLKQKIQRPAVDMPQTVHVTSPSGKS